MKTSEFVIKRINEFNIARTVAKKMIPGTSIQAITHEDTNTNITLMDRLARIKASAARSEVLVRPHNQGQQSRERQLQEVKEAAPPSADQLPPLGRVAGEEKKDKVGRQEAKEKRERTRDEEDE